jgi:dihydroneopterin aldolase/2-amino-4-hydroxy-6-hydroxymethyldihydropteridine diphosphokinase
VTTFEHDRITLTGLRVEANHGVLPEERQRLQPFVIDVELSVALGVAAATDDVAATVHYGLLAERLTAAATADPVDLIETLAERLARVALEDELVDEVRLTVHKPEAPIPLPFGDVAVTVVRRRPGAAVPVVVALGGNEGDREAIQQGAITALRRLPGLVVTAVSRPVETVAVTLDGPDESRPRYLNRVLLGESDLPAPQLLAALHGVERVFGRVRAERWGDRTLDLDLVAYGDARIDDGRLVVPHPRAAEREFVLAPWLELDPAAVLPGAGRVADLLARLRSR